MGVLVSTHKYEVLKCYNDDVLYLYRPEGHRRDARRHHHRIGGDDRIVASCAGVFDFALPPRWCFAICRRHVCCTAYLQPLAHRRRPDVPSAGRVSPLAIIISPVVTVS